MLSDTQQAREVLWMVNSRFPDVPPRPTPHHRSINKATWRNLWVNTVIIIPQMATTTAYFNYTSLLLPLTQGASFLSFRFEAKDRNGVSFLSLNVGSLMPSIPILVFRGQMPGLDQQPTRWDT